MKVSVGVSNRHIHLTQKHLEMLFGDNYELEKIKELNQPGQYASSALLTIKTDKSEIANVRVLGPVREYTQVEISKTDAYHLGINPPIRNSGDLAGSETVRLIGPNGEFEIKECCIIATRHIHMLPEQAEKYGLDKADKVCVRINGEKSGIIENVYLRVADNSYFEMHLDTDDANAHLVKNGDIVDII